MLFVLLASGASYLYRLRFFHCVPRFSFVAFHSLGIRCPGEAWSLSVAAPEPEDWCWDVNRLPSPLPCAWVGRGGCLSASIPPANPPWHVLGSPGCLGSLADQEAACPSRPKLLSLCCLHAGKFIRCGFFPESSNATLMRSDGKVTAQGRRGWGVCPELGSASPAPLCLWLAGAAGTSLAALEAAGGGSLPFPQGGCFV